MKLIFFGSDDFALCHLKRLREEGFTIAACVTAPDRRRHRGMKLVVSPIKAFALEHGIPVWQPESLSDGAFIHRLQAVEADFFVVVAYGRILSRAILEIPRVCAVNVHGSLLPRYRGAAPIHWAVIRGEKTTGVTIIRMNERMDAGDILSCQSTPILPDDTAETLRQRLMAMGAGLLVSTLRAWSSVRPRPQDEAQVTLAPKLTRETGRIHWDRPAQEVHNLVRGVLPWPGAYTFYKGKMLKILKTRLEGGDSPSNGRPGEVVGLDKDGFWVSCRDRPLFIQELHLAGGRRMTAKCFLQGYTLPKGHFFSK